MDTQGLTLLLDVSHRGCEDVLPIGDELQLAAELLFPAFRVNIRDDSRSLNRRVDTTEDDVCSATYAVGRNPVSYTHLRAHETDSYLVCRLLLDKKKRIKKHR